MQKQFPFLQVLPTTTKPLVTTLPIKQGDFSRNITHTPQAPTPQTPSAIKVTITYQSGDSWHTKSVNVGQHLTRLIAKLRATRMQYCATRMQYRYHYGKGDAIIYKSCYAAQAVASEKERESS